MNIDDEMCLPKSFSQHFVTYQNITSIVYRIARYTDTFFPGTLIISKHMPAASGALEVSVTVPVGVLATASWQTANNEYQLHVRPINVRI